MKRIATPKAVPITDKKERVWIVKPMPGPHRRNNSIPLGILLRDILKVASTLREVKKILSSRKVLVDGVVRVNEKFPLGLMDVVSLPDAKKNFRILVDWKGRLVPVEVEEKETESKILKVVRKHTSPGGKITVTFHDGKNMIGDNHIRVGDSIVAKLPKAEMISHLKLETGARCLISETFRENRDPQRNTEKKRGKETRGAC